MDSLPAEGLALRQRRLHPGALRRPPGGPAGPGPGVLYGRADGGRLPGGRARAGTAAAPSQRALRPLRPGQGPRPGEARIRAEAPLPGGVRAPGGRLRRLREGEPGGAGAGRSPGRSPLPELRRRRGAAPVPGLPGGPAAHRLRGPQAAVCLPPGGGAPAPPDGGLRGVPLRPAGAGLFHPGLLQEPRVTPRVPVPSGEDAPDRRYPT